MTLKRYLLVLMAALAVFACKPAPDPDDYIVDPQEQTDEEDLTSVEADEAGHIGTDEARLYGAYSNASATPEELGFEWGTSADALNGKVVSESVVSGRAGMFNAWLKNLSPDTEYYYRAYIKVAEKTYYSSVISFRTEEDGTAGSGVKQPGWFEVPAIDANRTNEGWIIDNNNPDLYYAFHKADIGTRNYTVCYNGAYHCPVWVAGPRHDIYSVGSGRNKTYYHDPDIPEDVQQKDPGSAGSTVYNRGHMLGSAERTGSEATRKQVYYVTNIAPQETSGFNTGGGGWNTLEDFVDGFQCSDTLYVVIGTLFEDFTDGYNKTATKKTAAFMGSTVQIPTAFYYALLRTKSGNSKKSLLNCERDEIMCAAFVRTHTSSLKGQAVSAKEMMSIDQLEELTGFDYFPAVPNAPEDTFNASDWGL